MTTRISAFFAAVAAAAILISSACQASIVFDNGNHVDTGRWASNSPSLSINHSAADFLIPLGATITDVHWKGLYEARNPIVDDFTILIYADNGAGLPTPLGSHIYSSNVGSVPRTATGDTVGGRPVFEYSTFIPAFVAAPATTYWLEIFNNSVADIWYWSVDNPGGQGVSTELASSWVQIGDDHTFQLTDDGVTPGGVPEATSLLVWSILSGVALIFANRRAER